MGKLIVFCAVSAWAHFPIHVDKTSADDGFLNRNHSSFKG